MTNAGKRSADVYYLGDSRPTREPRINGGAGLARLPNEGLGFDPGAALKAAREARRLSLEDLARTTKINARVLRALEETQIDKLPAPVFARGFLKAYAREVGLDPETTANAYMAHFAPVSAPPATHEMRRPPSHEEGARVDAETERFMATQRALRIGRLVAVAAVFAFAAYVGAFDWLRRPEAQPATPDTPPAVVGDAAPAASTSSNDQIAPADLAAGPLKIELVAQGPCWLRATMEGNTVIARLLQSGDRRSLDLTTALELRIGDPAALSVSINGRPTRPLGRAGEPVTIVITRDTAHELLNP